VEHQKIDIPYPGLSLEMCPYQQSAPDTWMAVAVEEAMAAIQATVA
jgi:ribosome modulation factor